MSKKIKSEETEENLSYSNKEDIILKVYESRIIPIDIKIAVIKILANFKKTELSCEYIEYLLNILYLKKADCYDEKYEELKYLIIIYYKICVYFRNCMVCNKDIYTNTDDSDELYKLYKEVIYKISIKNFNTFVFTDEKFLIDARDLFLEIFTDEKSDDNYYLSYIIDVIITIIINYHEQTLEHISINTLASELYNYYIEEKGNQYHK